VEVHWAGGFVSHHRVIRPVARYEHLRDYPGCFISVPQRRATPPGAARTTSLAAR
jgi:hypothetical protein